MSQHAELKRIITESNNLKSGIHAAKEKINAIDGQLQSVGTREQLEELKLRRNTVVKELENLRALLKNLKVDEKELKEKCGVVVSEHAMLRYFERILGFDLNEIRNQIVPDKIQEQISVLRSGLFPVKDFRLRVKDGTVVTVIGKRKKNDKKT